jgi:hypothetical protein
LHSDYRQLKSTAKIGSGSRKMPQGQGVYYLKKESALHNIAAYTPAKDAHLVFLITLHIFQFMQLSICV